MTDRLNPPDTDLVRFKRTDRAVWAAIGAATGAVLIASTVGSFQMEWSSFLKPVLVAGLLVLMSWFYAAIRRDAALAAALIGAAQIIAFAAVGAPLSYVAASAAFPLWDSDLAALDQRLGFDWMAWLATMNAAPLLHRILAAAYASFAVQATAVVVVLAAAGHALRLRIFMLSFVLTTLLTIGVSTLMPAQGVWGHLHLSAIDSPAIVPITRDLPLPVFFGLRDGSFRHLVAEGAEGIISFPSLHAALGLLFLLALWPVRYVGWIAVLLNVAMIAATPVDGSHYFSDVAAGLTIALLSWVMVQRTLTVGGRTEAGRELYLRPL
ncbi:phosphatase PAP2 family protein [Bradyrhizobium liaoningense]|uniref:phosphatase PAP2 family protein n=1 Tax=Bradyrhizobium liaoningense TaxID=43992 RepID=UPI001BA77269|nr:phosphatase PAP2 family protein [Bradyrhizobium liaoningense]MBR0841387.1 phosphatase PAP2 family protein [Bradyrhizobium liaoningense]